MLWDSDGKTEGGVPWLQIFAAKVRERLWDPSVKENLKRIYHRIGYSPTIQL